MSYIGHAPTSLDRSTSTYQPTPAQLQAQHPGTPTENDVDEAPTPTEDVGQLARYLSTQSTAAGGNLFEYEKGSHLDPFSDSFDVKLWTRKFASLEDWGQPRASGVSFEDMSVFGFGTDAGMSPPPLCFSRSTDTRSNLTKG